MSWVSQTKTWDPMLRLMPLEQKIFLSLLGPEPWRVYRSAEHAQASMVLSLFPVEDPWGTIFRGTHAMFRAMKRSGAFSSSDALEAHVIKRLAEAASQIPYEPSLPQGTMRAVLDTVFDDTQNLMGNLNVLATLMMDSIERYYPLEELAPHAAIWFELCDATVNIHTEVIA